MRIRIVIISAVILLALALAAVPAFNRDVQVSAAPDIFASPVHGGCYIAAANDCRIHVEPFTINISSGSKLFVFSLVAIRFPSGAQTVIYNWKPDQSNPAPALGTTYTPSLVAQDYAATCGTTYEISLQGRDSLDSSIFNLGLTGQFTCPSAVP